jgi:phosphoribosyl 1,2-cyclic phosphodiesterase
LTGSNDDHPAPLAITFWGTRGSIPSPGASMARFGGNTSCLEVCASDGSRCILDAGTGIRELGLAMQADSAPPHVDLLLTHFHWDHIQGLPFFAPAHAKDSTVRIHAPSQEHIAPAELLARQMAIPFFPVPFDALEGIKEVITHNEAEWTAQSFSVRTMKVCHPSPTVGYRIESGGATLVYIPDNEIGLLREQSSTAYKELVAFCSGADLLVHDAMYTTSEYPDKVGWGHSTFAEAAALAGDAGVSKLRLFHHAPERTDAELATLVDQVRGEWLRSNITLDIAAAAEGERIQLLG